MVTGLTFYLSFSGSFCKPSIDYLWGESTHFVHHEDGKSTPLNKEWSVYLHLGFVYSAITFTKVLEAT